MKNLLEYLSIFWLVTIATVGIMGLGIQTIFNPEFVILVAISIITTLAISYLRKKNKKLSKINNSTFDKTSNDVKKNLEGYTTYVDSLIGPSIWFEQTLTPQSKKKIEKLSGGFAFTDNDHNVQDKINEIIDHLNNQNK